MRPLKEINEFVREFTKEAPSTYPEILRIVLDTTGNRAEISAAYTKFIQAKTKEKQNQ